MGEPDDSWRYDEEFGEFIDGNDMTLDEFAGPVRLDARAATSCPVKVQWDIIGPTYPADDTPFMTELARRGVAFEADVIAELLTAQPDTLVLDRTRFNDDREGRTRAAMKDGVRVIVGGRLAWDTETKRVGEPDILVRVSTPATSGRAGHAYIPVDIKSHRTLDTDAPDDLRGTLPLAELGIVAPSVRPADAPGGGSERDDLLQLAHYWRMLERLGFAADTPMGVPMGAIIGRERLVVGYDLSAPRFPAGRNRDGEPRSALDTYDREYAERLFVVTRTLEWFDDPLSPHYAQPVRISECATCRWREHCGTILEAREDVSLLPRIGRSEWEALRRVGAVTIPELAELPATTVVDGMSEGALERARAQARARLGAAPAYRWPGVDRVEVERADVELDVDMENVEEGAYLWGVHVTDRAGAGMGAGTGVVAEGYHAFVDWDPDAETAGRRAFAGFWAWLAEVRRGCAERGLTLRCYHWSSAELRWMREAGRALGVEDEVEAAVASGEWVDLLPEFRRQVVTGYGNGLKAVAPLLGFAWDDDDPSGTSSMLWWQIATDHTRTGAEREFTRERLLAYNADDVRATLHVREWMDSQGSDVPELPDA